MKITSNESQTLTCYIILSFSFFLHLLLHHLNSAVKMEVKNEFLEILQKVWSKLEGLPQASPLELGAFFVLILFVGKFS